MASNYVPLEEAARILGVSPDKLVEMRSRGELRGFRDGASWKFPQDEIDRLRDQGIPGGGSDIGLGADPGGSDVALVPRQGQGDGSDVEVVASGSSGDSGLEVVEDNADDALKLAPEGSGALDIGGEPTEGSTGPSLGSDLAPANDSGVDVLGEADVAGAEQGGTGDLIRGDSDPDLAMSGGVDDALSDDDELVIADDDDDDLVLSSGGSDISIAGDSGINLQSPSDSGLSLESEPLDLAGSSISALDLGEDGGGESPSSGGEGSGSLVDFQADEEFQLSPSGVGVDSEEDDSGSQVIEVEDSEAFAEEVDFGAAEGGVMAEDDAGLLDDSAVMAGEGLVAEDADDAMGMQPMMTTGAPAVAQGEPFGLFSVLALAVTVVLMCIGGMLATDLLRNLWTYEPTAAPVSSLTDILIDFLD
jgi:excisionase family DNA binding protein